MEPLIVAKRSSQAGGLWTPYLIGAFKEGNTASSHFMTGSAAIKELNGKYRLFLSDVKVVERQYVARAGGRKSNKGGGNNEEEQEEEDGDDNKSDASSDAGGLAQLHSKGMPPSMPVVLPPLYLYLSVHKPKARMADVHRRGVRLTIKTNAEGLFGRTGSVGDFSVPLSDIPDIQQYSGLAVVKRPEDAPVTEEPIVFAFVRFAAAKSQKLRSLEMLHVSETISTMALALRGADDSSLFDDPKKASKNNPAPQQPTTTLADIEKQIRSLSHYSKLANEAWIKFNLTDEDRIDFDFALKLLDFVNVFVVQVQAERIFKVVNRLGGGRIDIAEFENFLIAIDIIGPCTDLALLDAFDGLKYRPSAEFQNVRLDGSLVDPTVLEKEVESEVSDGEAEEKSKAADASAEGDKPVKKKTKAKKAQPKAEKNANSSKAVVAVPKQPDYIDYPGFCEAMVMLQIPDTEEKELMETFTSAVNAKGSVAMESIMAPYPAFKKAWCKLCDAGSELRKRKLKPDKGLLGDGRNRERLNRWLTKYEEVYLKRVNDLNNTIEDLKRNRRAEADERRQKAKEKRAALKRAADRFAAIRNQEKRLEMKRDQEDRAKKRMEEKVLRNKLMQRQAENKLQRDSQIREANQAAENLRADEIRRRGWDKIDLSISNIRAIPAEVSSSKAATKRLSYVVLMDISHNMIEKLPEENFFYWLTAMRHFKASKNRLESLPAAEFHQAAALEIVEVDSNRLVSVPPTLGLMQNLQRLDLSNNCLTSLPSELGDCLALKFLSIHSNKIKYLPNRLGNLIHLEHLNASRNMLIELPEETQYMGSLLHLDVAGNYLSTLPTNIGNCEKIKYIDASVNRMTYLPLSFSQLSALEFANFESNDADLMVNNLSKLSSLCVFKMKSNKIQNIYGDIGGCINLAKLDLSSNNIVMMSAEIGLCTSLTEILLKHNNLNSIPAELGACGGVEILDASYNRIRGQMADSIGQLRKLKQLVISHNKITSFPHSILGLSDLTTMRADDNSITELPASFAKLHKLVELDLSLNNLTKFPLQIIETTTLRVLMLHGNKLTLLPRVINKLTYLEKLDISANKLRALPVEFVEIFESVPEVTITDNPWTDLPPKWNTGLSKTNEAIGGTIPRVSSFADASNTMTVFKGSATAIENMPGQANNIEHSAFGNSAKDALNFLYGMKQVYDTCVNMWRVRGAAYYTHRLSISDFREEVRRAQPHSWHEGLVEHVDFLFLRAKQTGNFPVWYELDEAEEAVRQERESRSVARREDLLAQVRTETSILERRMKEVYDSSNVRAAMRDRALRFDPDSKSQIISKEVASESLRHILRDRGARFDHKERVREKMMSASMDAEVLRLLKYAEDVQKLAGNSK